MVPCQRFGKGQQQERQSSNLLELFLFVGLMVEQRQAQRRKVGMRNNNDDAPCNN